ncbi:hypothetical protein GQ600_11747 [Phytophthora cactorum]|nr:hypothetical protein GQ600_11747 [Phytophthora cactorum]
MKSANRPTSANYNPREIARRLEHTLYMGAPSKQEYSNAVPFPGASTAMNQQTPISQPLQMPVNIEDPGSIAAVSTTPATTAPSSASEAAGAGSSILDELEREAMKWLMGE